MESFPFIVLNFILYMPLVIPKEILNFHYLPLRNSIGLQQGGGGGVGFWILNRIDFKLELTVA